MIANNVIASTINESIQEAWNKVLREIGGRIISKLDYVLTLQIDEGAENGIYEDSATVISERNAILLKNSNRICFCVDEKQTYCQIYGNRRNYKEYRKYITCKNRFRHRNRR